MSGPWFRTAFGPHYRTLYAHRDQAEADRCLDLLPRLGPLAPGRVLDLGCGEGRHLAGLVRLGCRPVGLDLSPELLRSARERDLPTVPLVLGDMRRLPFGPRVFDAVVSLFTAFGYFGPLAANAPVVAEVARALRPGGCWFLDYFDADRLREELADRRPRRRTRRAGNLAVVETRRLTADGRQVIKDVVLELPGASPADPPRTLEYREEVAVFALPELDELAGRHGLRRTAAAGSYGGDPLGAGDRWLLVYRLQEAAA